MWRFALLAFTACLNGSGQNDTDRITDASSDARTCEDDSVFEDAGLAPLECPGDDEFSCPCDCQPVRGLRYDLDQGCYVPTFMVCSRAEGGTGDSKCVVDTDTGEIYRMSGHPLAGPGFSGWRACDDDERNAAFEIHVACDG
jgi:hypothetical protein